MDLYERFHVGLGLVGLLAGFAVARLAPFRASGRRPTALAVSGIVTTVGVWAAVPDTEVAVAMVGLAIGLSIATRNPLTLPVPWMVAVMWAGTMLQGTAGIGSAWVAAVGCLGGLPVMALLRRSPTVVAVVTHVAVVVIASRVMRHADVAVGAPLAAIGIALCSAVAWWSGRGPNHELA